MSDAYRDGILSAWQGEQVGKAFFDYMVEATDDPALREKWQVLGDLEEATGNCLAPLVDAGAQRPAAGTFKLGAEAAAAFAALPYADALQQIKDVVDPAIEKFERLLEQAPEADREIVQILVDHEFAIRTFVQRELAGESATSLDPTRAVIERARASQYVTESQEAR